MAPERTNEQLLKDLKGLEPQLNQGRGSVVVQRIISRLEDGRTKDAWGIAYYDHDKIRQYGDTGVIHLINRLLGEACPACKVFHISPYEGPCHYCRLGVDQHPMNLTPWPTVA